MASVFPGAGDLATYWSNIVSGVDAVRDVSPRRWDQEFFHPDSAADSGASGGGAPGGGAPGGGAPGVDGPDGELGSGAKPVVAADRIYCRRGGFVEEFATFDPIEFGIMPLAVDWAEPDQLLALRVAAEAVADAGGADTLGDRGRTGVVLGRGSYLAAGLARLDQRVKVSTQLVTTLRELVPTLTTDQLAAVRAAFVETLGPDRPEAAIGLVPNLAASRIANWLDLRGPAYTLDAACASSLIAVDTAVRELAGGRADAMIAGGVHLVQEVTFWSVFSLLRALSPTSRIRPFDRRADGILIGEGVGMVVLKRLADAERAGDRIYAVIRGCGVSSDGRSSTLLAPSQQGQILAVERAWADAGLDPTAPGALGLVEAHGTATPVGDAAELATLGRVFGRATDAPPIGIGSVKSMIGHAMPAAGAAGLIKAILALHHRTLPPTLHCEQPHPALASTRFEPIREAATWEAPDGVQRRAGVNAFGFGGINAHVVVEEAPTSSNAPSIAFPVSGVTGGSTRQPGRSLQQGAERVLLVAGASTAALVRALAVPDEELLARDDAGNMPTGGPYRLAIVAPDSRRLALARTIVERGTAWRGRNDLWFTASPLLGRRALEHPDGTAGPGKVAFLFCGLEDGFHPRVDDVRAHFALPHRAVDAGTVDASTVDASTGVLGTHGVASVEVGRILDMALRRLEIVPDVLGGHSIGEWNAMISAGMIADDFVDRFINSFDPSSLDVPGVVFGALGCGVSQAVAAIDGLSDVVISHDNCPHQSIICGGRRSVTTTLERLRGQGVLCRILPFRSGFHSPFFAPYLDRVRMDVARTPIGAATVPVWSATTVAPYPQDPAAVRDLFARHLLEPVRFRGLTEALYAAGVRVFVAVGTGSIAGFVQDTMARAEYLTVVTNTPKRSGLDQLRRVAAALWVEGASPRMDLLPTVDRAVAAPAAVSGSAPAAVSGSEPAASRTRRGRPMLLNLGAPLIRLGERAAALAPLPLPEPARPLADQLAEQLAEQLADQGEHPVLAEFAAFMADTNEMVSTVVGRWAARKPPAAAPGAEPGAAVTAALPGPPRSVRRTLSIETMPYIIDHCFYGQPPGWPHLADRFPVIPMTTLLEMMIDEARAFAPGRVALGLTDIRALRWLAIAPAVEVTITAVAVGPDAVMVNVEGYARGTVILGDDYPAPPTPSDEPLPDLRRDVVDGQSIYRSGRLFHGPGFQGLVAVGPISPKGVHGEFVVTEAPGALLDTAGQLFGYWPMEYLRTDWLLLPTTIRSLRFFGPPPVVGDRLTGTVWVRDVGDTTVTADLEIRAADGTVWAVIEGWKDRRFSQDDVTWAMLLSPARSAIAERAEGGWVFVRERWHDTASRELMLRHHLDADERAALAARNPKAARQWLIGRIAAKDAVRHWLWDGGAGDVWGIEIGVSNEPSGRPVIDRLPDRGGTPIAAPPHVSLAHTGFLGVALVHPEGDVGIDIERVAPRAPGVETLALAETEQVLLTEVAGADPDRRALWFTRFWTAKESVAKADGVGLAGQPKRFVVDTVAPGHLRVRVDAPRAHVRWVAHQLIDKAGEPVPDRAATGSTGSTAAAGSTDRAEADHYVVAWTSPAVERAASGNRWSAGEGNGKNTNESTAESGPKGGEGVWT
ncbi:beta-ketoacyl synthase N-terminal-like domain-containing protein [Frankia sp. Cas3]|uniref:beta-ketoacyl synthase N-terminal-like domain-containing protein n=1 Tax=Frankia sp. Cas3 TaxID=3073926 RepID=UPI003A0FCEF0